MKSTVWLLAAAMSVSSLALAQTVKNPGVTEITDQAKIAEIEQHAQRLASGAAATPMMGEHDHMQKHDMRHYKHKGMHKRAMKDKAPSDTPMANDSKG